MHNLKKIVGGNMGKETEPCDARLIGSTWLVTGKQHCKQRQTGRT